MEEQEPGPDPGPGGFFGGQQQQHQQHREREDHEQRPHGDDGRGRPGAGSSSRASSATGDHHQHRASGASRGVGGATGGDGPENVGRTAATPLAPATRGGAGGSYFVRDPAGGDGWVCPHCVDGEQGGQGRAQGWYFQGRGGGDHAPPPPREFVEGHLAICPGYNRAVGVGGRGGHNYHYNQFAPPHQNSPPHPSPPTGTHHHPNHNFLGGGGGGSAPAWHGSPPGPSPAGYYAATTPTTTEGVPPSSSLPPLQPQPQPPPLQHYHHPAYHHQMQGPPPPPPPLAPQQGTYPSGGDSYGGYPTSPSYPHQHQFQQAQAAPTGTVAGTYQLHHQPQYPYAPLPPPPPPLLPSPHQLARANNEAASTSLQEQGPPSTRASEEEAGGKSHRRRHNHRGKSDGAPSNLPTGPAGESSSPTNDTRGAGDADGDGQRATSPSSSSNLVLAFDKPLLTDYFYLMIQQLQFCRFEESDRKSRGRKRENVLVGFPGIECRHCAGASISKTSSTKPRRFFWANVDRLANSFAAISDHVTRCTNCPDDIRAALEDAKILHREQMARLPKGSQKVFLRRMWRRLHPEREDGGGGDDDDADGQGVGEADTEATDIEAVGTDESTTKNAGMPTEASGSVGVGRRCRPSSAPSPPNGGPSTRSSTRAAAAPQDQQGGGVQQDREDHQEFPRRPSSAPGTGAGGNGPATAASSQDKPSHKMALQHRGHPDQKQQRVLLAISGDRQWLSDYDCEVRKSLEVFVATEDEVAAHRTDKRYPLRVGRVGLRCVYCASSSEAEGATGYAVSYPRCVNGIHEAVREIARLHLDIEAGGGCPNFPPEVRERWRGLSRTSTSLLSVLRPYYVIAAKALGLYDASDGVRCDGFHPTLQGSGPGSSPPKSDGEGSPSASASASGAMSSSSPSSAVARHDVEGLPYPSPENFSPVTGEGVGHAAAAAAASKRGRSGDDGGGTTSSTPDGTGKKSRRDRDGDREDSTTSDSASASIEGIIPHPV